MALRVLRLLAEHPDGLGVSDISRRLEIGRSTAHLLLSTLAEQEFATQTGERRYVLGFTAFEIGAAVPDTTRFGGKVLGPMRELADLSGEAVSLAVPRNRDAVIVQRFESQQVLRVDIGIGTRMPMVTCASGKVMLAAMPEEEVDRLYPNEELPSTTRHSVRTKAELKASVLPEVRIRRYATTLGEFAEGIDGVGAGITDRRGAIIACLSVAGPSSRFDCDKWAETTVATADAMTEILARRGV